MKFRPLRRAHVSALTYPRLGCAIEARSFASALRDVSWGTGALKLLELPRLVGHPDVPRVALQASASSGPVHFQQPWITERPRTRQAIPPPCKKQVTAQPNPGEGPGVPRLTVID